MWFTTGVTAADIGDYKCKVGYQDEVESQAESSELKLRIKPSADGNICCNQIYHSSFSNFGNLLKSSFES